MSIEAWTPIAIQIIGAGVQWARAFPAVPEWLMQVLIFAAAVVLYGVAVKWQVGPDITTFIAGLWVFYQAVRGATAQAKDTGLAPATNSK